MFNELDTIISYEDSITFESSDIKNPDKDTSLYDNLTNLLKTNALLQVKEVIRFIATYIDKHSSSLIITGPYEKILFIEANDANPLFKLLGVEKSQITSIIKQCSLIKSNFMTLNNPFFFLLVALIMIYSDNSSDKLCAEANQMCQLYLAIRFYSARQSRIWKYGPKKEIMDYTINNLNNKYVLKSEKTIIGMLKYLAKSNDDMVGEALRKNHYDKDFKYYITNISTRINNTLANIWKEYDANSKNKKYLNSDASFYTNDDSEDQLKELNNISTVIMNICDRVYHYLKNNAMDSDILKDASTITKIKSSSIQYTLEEIIADETTILREIITLILQLFLTDMKNTSNMVKSKYFAIYCMNVYKISNSKDKGVLRIKDILNDWIKKYGSQYMRLNREATIINFRKAIYIYIVNNIIKYA